ncbi:hypothetical protein SPRG_06792 [Saprolegnia parasitica CBS 223.65]|uniref:Uncharacterized protein n=1 Tax=Saprolegnia parasitica (strain CBS 223.65) TaxID=695850 RepID=A0A067CEB9_SAPPC|nr:hypothetical protein SPRG_06792 [Saprolegnia parasitica CBS 223.65]KDO27525.1 hypothetical protein SPRG_06792 [Saprolegnia parasitica CBS 223.65]|eukprot:XP_012201652.1 hypothetical protein SPRG_06792 [Saprolegnia parasitica CBS 223.65]
MAAGGSHVVLEAMTVGVGGAMGRDWFYDSAHQCVIALSPCADGSGEPDGRLSLQLTGLPDASAMPTGRYGSYAQGTAFCSAKLSTSKQFLALQRSDVEVEIAVLREPHHRFNVLCKRSSRILGLVWSSKIAYLKTSTEYLVLVTTGGLEQFKVTPAKCTFQRLVAHATFAYWYNADAHLVVLQTGATASELRPFILEGAIVTKCSKVVVAGVASVCVATLYETHYILHCTSSQLLFYRIEAGTDTKCVRALELPFPAHADVAFSVVDNVVVAHSRAFGVSCLYDVALDVAEPVVSPLPPAPATTPDGRFLWPKYYYHAGHCFAKVTLALVEISRCASAGLRASALLRFLLRRADAHVAKCCVFACLHARITDRAPVAEVTSHFHLLHRIYGLAMLDRDPRRSGADQRALSSSSSSSLSPGELVDVRDSKQRMLVVLQRECYAHFWLPLHQAHPPDVVHLYLSAYLHTLEAFAIPIEPAILQLYVQVLVQRGQCHEGLAFLAAKHDSPSLARELELQATQFLFSRTAYRPFFQVALDMYHRLGRVDDVLRLLLDDNNVSMALRLAQRVLHKHDHLPAPAWFYDAVASAATRADAAPASVWQWFTALHLFLRVYDKTCVASPSPSPLALAATVAFPFDRFATAAMASEMARRFGFDDSAQGTGEDRRDI